MDLSSPDPCLDERTCEEPMLRNVALGMIFLLLTSMPVSASAQADTDQPNSSDIPAADPASVAPPPATDDTQELAKKLSNPIASLISLPFQSNYDWGLGPNGNGTQYKLNIQPVIPISLNSDWNVISRTIVPVIIQNKVLPTMPNGDTDQAGIGDTVQSLFFSPKSPTSGGLIWGAGPVFYVPTATDRLIGAQQWGAGPTVVILKQMHGWTVGALANHIWSVAGNNNRDKISSTFLQPFVSYSTRKATTFGLNTESTYDWVHNQWTVPVNVTVGQIFPPKKTGLPFPFQLTAGYRHYFVKAPGGPENGVRFVVTALFPKGK